MVAIETHEKSVVKGMKSVLEIYHVQEIRGFIQAVIIEDIHL